MGAAGTRGIPEEADAALAVASRGVCWRHRLALTSVLHFGHIELTTCVRREEATIGVAVLEPETESLAVAIRRVGSCTK